jgi:hypothetical protein
MSSGLLLFSFRIRSYFSGTQESLTRYFLFSPFVLFLSVLIAGLFASACDVAAPEDPVQPRTHTISLTDTSILLSARFSTGFTTPELRVHLTMTVQTQADSAKILSYEVEVGGSSRQLLAPLATIYNGTHYVISINELFQNLKPWVSKPKVRVALLLRSYLNKRDSLRTFEMVKFQTVQWDSSVEPGLRQVPFESNQRITTGIVWSKDSEGFYFHVINGQTQRTSIQYYRLWDSSVVSVTPPTASLQALHLSNNNQSLLVTDVGVAPSNLYIISRTTGAQRLLWETRDSIRITSARYSTSDYKIVFSGARSGGSEYPMYLMDLRDSSVVRLEIPSRYRNQEITGWLTNSNDKFVFHTAGRWLYIYTISSLSLSTVTFPEPFRPHSLLPDGFSVLGVRVEDADAVVRESHIWLYDIRQLSFLPEVVSDLELSPNGKLLAFVSVRGGVPRLFLLPVSNILD